MQELQDQLRELENAFNQGDVDMDQMRSLKLLLEQAIVHLENAQSEILDLR